ncbi:MAG: LD-carboxypeptidase [Saprospiraceae bacterium]|nr:LD-carboxypeptidase [Saprospiraceae bacterium]
MLRRNFFKITGLAALTAGFSNFNIMAENSGTLKPRLIKPTRLREGTTVALIAPSSPPAALKLEKGIANLTRFGFKILEGKSLRAHNGYLAGTDAERLADLHWAFQHPEIEAVWCIRGGYGAGRLLPDLDFDLIRLNPKPLIGYSDVTALHIAIHQRTGLVTFHGPVAASDYPEDTLNHFKSILMQPAVPYEIAAPTKGAEFEPPEYQPFVITPGQATGALTGGNLALLSALAGTPFAPVFKKKIVFIEDVGEQPYRLDRMLTQLLQATDLAQAAGIALGVFNECQPKPESPSLSLPDALRDRLGGLGIPVVYGIPFGHIDHQATVPYGIPARLDADKMSLTILEAAVL